MKEEILNILQTIDFEFGDSDVEAASELLKLFKKWALEMVGEISNHDGDAWTSGYISAQEDIKDKIEKSH